MQNCRIACNFDSRQNGVFIKGKINYSKRNFKFYQKLIYVFSFKYKIISEFLVTEVFRCKTPRIDFGKVI